MAAIRQQTTVKHHNERLGGKLKAGIRPVMTVICETYTGRCRPLIDMETVLADYHSLLIAVNTANMEMNIAMILIT